MRGEGISGLANTILKEYKVKKLPFENIYTIKMEIK